MELNDVIYGTVLYLRTGENNMKVRVVITETFTDEMRRALNAYFGETGLATREDIKRAMRNFNPLELSDALEEGIELAKGENKHGKSNSDQDVEQV